jgi:hypothetical protein
MSPADLSDPEAAIVAFLREGRATTGYMVDELGIWSMNWVYGR